MATAASQAKGASGWALLFGFFGGLVAWALHLAIGFILAYGGCRWGLAAFRSWLLIVTAALALVALAATVVAYRSGARTGVDESNPDNDEVGGSLGRSRLVAVLGTWLSGLSLLIILMVGIAAVWIVPCG